MKSFKNFEQSGLSETYRDTFQDYGPTIDGQFRGMHRVEDPSIIKELNQYIKTVQLRTWHDPIQPVQFVANRLVQLGLSFDLDDVKRQFAESDVDGTFEADVHLMQYGGRFGEDPMTGDAFSSSDNYDDGITHRTGEPLHLKIDGSTDPQGWYDVNVEIYFTSASLNTPIDTE